MDRDGLVTDAEKNAIDKSCARKKNIRLLVYCAVVAAAFLALCSKSSFLYPLNDWGDANCFLTVGKAMLHGQTLYRDIYDQKGPLLYFIYSLGWLVSHNSFLGVYLIETALFSWFLWLTAKTARLFLPETAVYVLLPVVSALILSSGAFCHGGSAEELCLPLVAYPLTVLIRYYKLGYPAALPYRQILLTGLFTGCILTIKFNLIGFHAVFIVSVLLACLHQKKYSRGGISLLVFLGGILAALLPWVVYFLLNHALKDAYTGYIFNNVFLYSKLTELAFLDRILGRLFHVLLAFIGNLQFSIPVVIGLAGILITHDFGASLLGRLSLVLGFIALMSGVYAGDVAYQYYALILSVFAVPGLIAVFYIVHVRLPVHRLKAVTRGILILSAVGVSLAFARAVSSNAYMLGERREELAQYKFRDIINKEDSPTLLNYGFLDFGVYTVCGIEPTCKYFCGLNIQLPEIRKTQDRFIKDKKADFVVTRNYTPGFILNNYTVVAQESQYFEGKTDTYYLLRRQP